MRQGEFRRSTYVLFLDRGTRFPGRQGARRFNRGQIPSDPIRRAFGHYIGDEP